MTTVLLVNITIQKFKQSTPQIAKAFNIKFPKTKNICKSGKDRRKLSVRESEGARKCLR